MANANEAGSNARWADQMPMGSQMPMGGQMPMGMGQMPMGWIKCQDGWTNADGSDADASEAWVKCQDGRSNARQWVKCQWMIKCKVILIKCLIVDESPDVPFGRHN